MTRKPLMLMRKKNLLGPFYGRYKGTPPGKIAKPAVKPPAPAP